MISPTLTEELFEVGYEFDFFQAVRILESMLVEQLPSSHDAVERLAAAIRVRALPSLSFPPSSIHRVGRAGAWDGERTDEGQPPVPAVTITFFGLFGPSGTLPVEYSEMLCPLMISPMPERTATALAPLREWFDLFNHQLGILLYAAWEKYRFPVRFERYTRLREIEEKAHPDLSTSPDPFTGAMLSLVGLGAPSLRGRLRVDVPRVGASERPPPLARIEDLALLHYSGILARPVPTAVGLEVLLSDYFGIGVRIEELTGQWLTLGPETATRMSDNAMFQLGRNTIAGERIFDVSSRFRVVLGPLRYVEFVEYLPDPCPVSARKGFFLLSQLVRLYTGVELDFDVQLSLLGSEVPECELQEVPEGDLGVRLGWNTWLPHTAPPAVVDDVCLDGDPRTVVSADIVC